MNKECAVIIAKAELELARREAELAKMKATLALLKCDLLLEDDIIKKESILAKIDRYKNHVETLADSVKNLRHYIIEFAASLAVLESVARRVDSDNARRSADDA